MCDVGIPAMCYRLWCIEPGNHKIVISRDVVFTEAEIPYLKHQQVTVESLGEQAAESEVESDRSEAEEESTEPRSPPRGSPEDLRNWML